MPIRRCNRRIVNILNNNWWDRLSSALSARTGSIHDIESKDQDDFKGKGLDLLPLHRIELVCMQHYADPDSHVPIRCTTWHFRDILGGCLRLSWPRFFLWNTKVILIVLGRSNGIDFLGTHPRKKITNITNTRKTLIAGTMRSNMHN